MYEIPIDGQELVFVDESDRFKEIYQSKASTSSSVTPYAPYHEVGRPMIIRKLHFANDYEMDGEKFTAEGKFGTVYACTCNRTKVVFAAKSIHASNAREKADVEREIRILSRMSHAGIVKLVDAIDTGRHLKEMILVMEMISGGELFDRIADKHFVMTETAIAMIVGQVCEAVRYVHKSNVVHLDVKPENILFESRYGNRVKLIDFGLAQELDDSKDLQMIAGTAEFIAPEVINFEALHYKTDMWSIGIITYILLSGISPFLGDTDPETYVNVTRGKWEFDEECFAEVTHRAKDFVSRLLVFDKSNRLSAEQSLQHPWISWTKRRSQGASMQKQRFVKYIIKRRWKRVVHAVLAVNRLRTPSSSRCTSTDDCESVESDGSK